MLTDQVKHKTIVVILPVNNPEMLNEADLRPYQSSNFNLQLSYVATSLLELNTAADIAEVIPCVVEQALAAERRGASAIIVSGFGDVGIQESQAAGLSIPIIGLGRAAVRKAYSNCKNSFTVIPSQLAHNPFFESLIVQEQLTDKFCLSTHAVGLNPAAVRKHPSILALLVSVASAEITLRGIDTLTLSCASYVGLGKPLEVELRKIYGESIGVVEPLEAAFEEIKKLVSV